MSKDKLDKLIDKAKDWVIYIKKKKEGYYCFCKGNNIRLASEIADKNGLERAIESGKNSLTVLKRNKFKDMDEYEDFISNIKALENSMDFPVEFMDKDDLTSDG